MTVQFHGGLLAGELVCSAAQRPHHKRMTVEVVDDWINMRIGATFYRMSVHGCSPLRLRLESSLLMVLSLDLLDAEMVLVDSYAQDYLCAILIDDELVEVLPQHFGRDVASAHIAGVAQWTARGLVRLIERREALAAEVGTIESRRFARVRLGQGRATRDAIEGEVGRAGLGRDGSGKRPPDRLGQQHRGRGGAGKSHYKLKDIEGITGALIQSRDGAGCARGLEVTVVEPP